MAAIERRREANGPRWPELEDKLLAAGGEEVIPPMVVEDSLERLLESGELLEPSEVELREGIPCHCHGNSARLWEEGVGKICTGYALSNDGLWRQHTWVVADGDKIIETTTKRVAYFGFILNEEESQQFAFENW